MEDIKIFLNRKKKKNWQYGHKLYKNLSEDKKKQKLVRYKKKYYRMRKKTVCYFCFFIRESLRKFFCAYI